jgi:lipid-A-disaccharide synthase
MSTREQRGAEPLIVWSAGEASGDRHAAEVVAAIRALRPEVRSVGLGGPAMADAGVELVAGMDEVSVVGLVEVLGRLPRIISVWRRLRALLRSRPALFVPVDFPGLNLRLAAFAHRQQVPIVYYVSPQIWAWGEERLRTIRRLVRRMLVLFPFEVPIYQQAGVPVTWVGHPLVEQVREVPERAAARRELGIDDDRPVLVLMPGSRRSEVGRLLDPMLAAAARLLDRHPDLRVLVRLAPAIDAALVERAARRHGVEARLVAGGDPRAVRAADAAIVASGTATLETGLLGTPMVIVYSASPLTWAIARRLVRIDMLGIVNVMAGRRIVPELLQRDLEPGRLADLVAELLDDPTVRERQVTELARVTAELGEPGAAERTARAILAELDR